MQRLLGPPPPASSEAVSRSMKSNRGEDTSPEMILRSALFKMGVRGYRLHTKGVPGRPDLVFSRKRAAVFVNGCFWHRCPQCNLPLPKTHNEFWRAKFELNIERDRRKRMALESEGWKVVTIWECEIRDDVDECVAMVRRALRGL